MDTSFTALQHLQTSEFDLASAEHHQESPHCTEATRADLADQVEPNPSARAESSYLKDDMDPLSNLDPGRSPVSHGSQRLAHLPNPLAPVVPQAFGSNTTQAVSRKPHTSPQASTEYATVEAIIRALANAVSAFNQRWTSLGSASRARKHYEHDSRLLAQSDTANTAAEANIAGNEFSDHRPGKQTQAESPACGRDRLTKAFGLFLLAVGAVLLFLLSFASFVAIVLPSFVCIVVRRPMTVEFLSSKVAARTVRALQDHVSKERLRVAQGFLWSALAVTALYIWPIIWAAMVLPEHRNALTASFEAVNGSSNASSDARSMLKETVEMPGRLAMMFFFAVVGTLAFAGTYRSCIAFRLKEARHRVLRPSFELYTAIDAGEAAWLFQDRAARRIQAAWRAYFSSRQCALCQRTKRDCDHSATASGDWQSIDFEVVSASCFNCMKTDAGRWQTDH
jgi:hypothetical protein